jgi:hypothetical protein
MSQVHPGSTNKKRNYTSPQKTQTSIVTFTNQNAPPKKFNSNHTPQRSSLSRSQEAIMRISSPPNISMKLALSNNPYKALLQDEEEEEEEELLESLVRVNQEVSPNTGEDLTASSKIRNTEEIASSSITISSPEKVLLSKKAQQALRKLKIARKALTDMAIREELEAAYGVEDATQIEDTRLEQASHSTPTKKIAGKKTG